MDQGAAVQGVSTFAELIYNYGPVVVILSVFLLLFISIIFYILRTQQKANENIMNEHRLLIETLLSQKVLVTNTTSTATQRSHKELMDIYLKVNQEIKTHVAVNIVMLKACRLAIYLFHNGTKGINRFPFFKFSCISEQVTVPKYTRLNTQVDYPVNLMSDFILVLNNNGEIVFYDEEHHDNSDTMINKILADDENKYIIRGIIDSSTCLIGFVLIEFHTEELDKDNYKEKSKIIDEFVQELTPILEYSNFSKIYQEANHNEA